MSINKTQQSPEHGGVELDIRKTTGRKIMAETRQQCTIAETLRKSVWRVSDTKTELLQAPAAGHGGACL